MNTAKRLKHIVLIEDSPEDRELVRRYLNRDPDNSYEIQEAERGEEGLRLCLAIPPDCVILDYELPDTNGLRILKELVEKAGKTSFPVVIWTGSGNEAVAVEAMQSGAQDYLIKGKTTPEKLKHVISGAMDRVEMARNLEDSRAELERRNRELEALSEKLRRSEARFRRVVESNIIGVFFWEIGGRITAANQAFLDLLGLSQDAGRDTALPSKEAAPLGFPMDWLALTAPEHRDIDHKALAELESRGGTHAYEKTLVRPDGKTVPVLFGLAFLEESRTEGVAFVLDISERVAAQTALRQSEERLMQSQKMEAIGRLAGGVAHDFNNLLMAINGYSSLLQVEMREDDPARPMVDEIHKAGHRAAALTAQLLAFSRKQVLAPREVDLNKVVAGMDGMLQRIIGEDIRLSVELEAGLGRIRVDPGQLEQIIVNLVVNARDAMPQGGRLVIHTGWKELSEADIGMDQLIPTDQAVKPGRYAMLSVTDTGLGMSEEVKKRLFEPFYTTKGLGKGTGLGLSTVYGIVRQSGGNILVYSEPGKGSAFKIYLPLIGAEVADAETPTAAATAQSGDGSQTVLLVEDEEPVRNLVRKILKGSGYVVMEADSGEEAVALSRRHQGPIALLLTDVVMAKMGGRELAEGIRAERPEIKVIYMSGYTDDAILRHGVLDKEAAFLQKPFSPSTLAQKVHEVLQEQKPG